MGEAAEQCANGIVTLFIRALSFTAVPPRSPWKCGALRDAEQLIAVALSGDPPAEIAEELRDLLEQVYFGSKKGRRRLTAT